MHTIAYFFGYEKISSIGILKVRLGRPSGCIWALGDFKTNISSFTPKLIATAITA